MSKLQSINPTNEELNAEVSLLEVSELDSCIDQAYTAYQTWKDVSFADKKLLFHELACVMEADIEEAAKLQTIEMGMLYSASKSGMEATVTLIRWFADNAEAILGEKPFESEGFVWISQYDSLGVIFGVAPWNFPFNQLLRAAVPNILAGNTQLYKHSSNVPLCAIKIQEWFDTAGFPKWVYTNIFVSSRMSEHIISHAKIAGVNLTGSEGAGSAVGSLAGKYLKPSVLELGGNDAFVVADTDNLEAAAEMALQWRIKNGWQACNSSKRIIIQKKYYTEFCEIFARRMDALVVGNPMDITTQIQPLSSAKAFNEVSGQVEKALASGARLIAGGRKIGKLGYFYAPTALADVTMEVSSFHEEIFWPVASLICSQDLEDSIRLANISEFWLSACVYGDNEEQVREIAKKLTGWMIFINQTAGSKASLPFGWVKKSGYGKENGPEGLKAFTNKKVILF